MPTIWNIPLFFFLKTFIAIKHSSFFLFDFQYEFIVILSLISYRVNSWKMLFFLAWFWTIATLWTIMLLTYYYCYEVSWTWVFTSSGIHHVLNILFRTIKNTLVLFWGLFFFLDLTHLNSRFFLQDCLVHKGHFNKLNPKVVLFSFHWSESCYWVQAELTMRIIKYSRMIRATLCHYAVAKVGGLVENVWVTIPRHL